MVRVCRNVFHANVKLFFFWISYTFKLFNGLPLELTNHIALEKRMKNGKEFIVNVNKSFITKYANDMNQLGIELKSLHNGTLPFKTRQIAFFITRTAVIMAAFSGYIAMSFVISLLQFIILPYSLFISIGYGIETAIMLFSGHLLIFPILKYFVDLLCPVSLNIYITFSPLFLTIFLFLDQLICALCLIQTPKGKTEKMSLRRVWQSVWYGFLNCKTYYLVLNALLFGQRLPLTVWIIDAVLGISTKISGYISGPYWSFVFYHVHRIGHIPNVYPDAHKFHHYLHDTTAFDAHVFGSGAPEEWLLIVIEFLIALLCGGMPPGLSYYVLRVSWLTKYFGHTRNYQTPGHEDNFHADHHVKHNKNFGQYYPLDIAMGTTVNREEYVFNKYKIKRIELADIVRLTFTPIAQSAQSTNFSPVTFGKI